MQFLSLKIQRSRRCITYPLSKIMNLRCGLERWVTHFTAQEFSLYCALRTTGLILRPPKIYGKPSKLTQSGSLVWLGRRSQKTIGSDTTAYARTLAIPTGDVKGLLRSLRIYFESSSVPHQHRLLSLLRKTNMADHPDLKAYVATLETIFARLAKIGHVVTDADKRYHGRTLRGFSARSWWLYLHI